LYRGIKVKKYLGIFVIVFIVYMLGESIYSEMNKDKTPGKAKRIECQKKAVTFERIFDDVQVQEAQNQVRQSTINFSSDIEKAVYTQSRLFEYFPLEKADVIFKNKLLSYSENQEKNKVKRDDYTLSYYIYENDANDPGKKTKKSKLYAGYVVFEVKNKDNKTIYKVQTDFMNHAGDDLKESLECTVESFMTYNNKGK